MAIDGDTVLVTNGVYETGGKAVQGSQNRVTLDKPIAVQSVNGPTGTIIHGSGSLRCAYLTNGAILAGFTLTNGLSSYGGGVFCESSSAVLSNCVLTGNTADNGGGAYGGTLYNCSLIGNSSISPSPVGGGGTYNAILFKCALINNSAYTMGGGAYNGTLSNCTLMGNSAGIVGGGTYNATLYNCTVISNTAVNNAGGGACYGTLYGCTLTGNRAGENAGGLFGATSYNCIVYYNTPNNWWTNHPDVYARGIFDHCCTTPDPGGTGNITNEPMFVDLAAGDLRLLSNSPCINAGTNQDWMASSVDLDGNPRISGGVVDMGAYERSICLAVVAVSPTNLLASCQEGENLPNHSFEVWNSDCATLNYEISDNANWLSEIPTSGTSTGEHDTIQVSYNAAGLAPGIYDATITVTGAPPAVGSPATIQIKLIVSSGAPEIVVCGTNGAFIANGEVASAAKGTDFGTLTVGWAATNRLAITNTGSAALIVSDVTTHGAGAAAFQVSGFPIQVSAGGVSIFSLIFQPTVSGVHTAVVEIANNSAITPYTLCLAGTGLKRDQTINFPNPGDQLTTNKVGLSATASSGLPVSFAVTSGPGTIEEGTNLTFTGTGVVMLVASQAGDENWNAAPDVTNTVLVLSAGTIQFKAAAYSVSETNSSARIWVSRIGGTFGAASVGYSTFDGTATAGVDYTAVSGTLNWTNGDGADKFFDVPIINDSVDESDEQFVVNLSEASGAGMGNPNSTTVTITDDETNRRR